MKSTVGAEQKFSFGLHTNIYGSIFSFCLRWNQNKLPYKIGEVYLTKQSKHIIYLLACREMGCAGREILAGIIVE